MAENVPLMAWKFISDNADGNSSSDWKKNVQTGVAEFKSSILKTIQEDNLN